MATSGNQPENGGYSLPVPVRTGTPARLKSFMRGYFFSAKKVTNNCTNKMLRKSPKN